MKNFTDYISDKNNIISFLCKYRAKLADVRHKEHLLNGLFPDRIEIQKHNEELESMMPPRRKWVSLKKEYRYKASDNGEENPVSTFKANTKRLEITIYEALKKESQEPWVKRLELFIEKLQQAALDPNYKIESPKTIPILKNKLNPDERNECRPISLFSNLLDRVLLSLVNKYLTRLFNPYFDDESLAFRSSRLYHGEKKYITTHHDAITRINEFRLKHQNKQIYVAECDMQKFYDSVSHKIIRKQLRRLFSKVQKDNPDIEIDIVRKLFYKYLNCYTFYKNVYVLNNNCAFWDRYKIPNGYFGWVNDELIKNRFCKNERYLSRTKIGIPQGGALSGLIANLVLNMADQKVRKIANGDYLYVRFCDDMMLMHTNKSKCKLILKEYINALKKLQLIPHEITNELPFRTKDFWKIKSKPVYPWGSKGSDWVGFVGYEIKRTGEIRIRKRSINKEKDKIRKITNDIRTKISNSSKRRSNGTIKSAHLHKLISMSVGKIALWNYKTIKSELCWTNGFKELADNKYASAQIKDLDRVRQNAIRMLAKHLAKEHNSSNIIHKDSKHKCLAYYGKPFSYYYHCLEKE